MMMNDQQATSLKLVDPQFLLKLVRSAQRINLLLAAALFGFIGLRVWQLTHPMPPYFIYTDGHGQPYRRYPLNQPDLSDDAVLGFAVGNIVDAYAVNWQDYRTRLTEVSHHFTRNGWMSFGSSFVKVGDLAKLKEAKLVGSAKPDAAAIILHEGVVGTRYTYEISFPLTAIYQNETRRIVEHLNMLVWVVRTPVVNHPEGVAIDQMNAIPQ